MPFGPLSVVVAEDNPLLLASIVQALLRAGFSIEAEAQTGRQLLALALQHRPSILIIKQDLPDISGIECASELRRALPPPIRIMISINRFSDFWEIVDCGVSGIVTYESIDLLPHAVKSVDAGKGWIAPELAHWLLQGRGRPLLTNAVKRFANAESLNTLSEREHEVLRLLADGQSNQQIADSLGLKLQTVKVHVKNILRKLDVSSRSQAISLVLKVQAT